MTVPDWSALPRDVLTFLAKRITSLKDYIALRAVCRAWRLAATKDCFPTTRQVPWLVLFRVLHDPEPSWRFHSLTKNTVHKPLLPFQPHLDRHICSSLGWMMGRGENADQHHLYLWHPLTHAQVQLPNHNFNFDTAKFALSLSPSWTSDYAIMVIFNEYSNSEPSYLRRAPCNVAFLKPGALMWTNIKLSQPAEDLASYKGQFYVVDCEGKLMVLDIEDPDHDVIKMKEIVSVDYGSLKKVLDGKYPSHSYRQEDDQYYIVESEGALFLVQRNNVWKRSYWFQPYHEIVEFHVFEVNTSNKTLARLNSLGDKTLFFGSGPSLSVKVSGDTGCKVDCIYFNMGCVTGIFDMKKEGFETLKHEGVHPFIPLPWLQQSF